MTANDYTDMTRADLIEARERGASNLLCFVAALDPHAVGVSANYAAAKLAADLPEDVSYHFGGYMTALWDGDLAEALYHADASNKRLLLRFLSEDLILSALAAERESMESAERWYNHHYERYGLPDRE